MTETIATNPPIILPEPGEDLHTWARDLVAVLQSSPVLSAPGQALLPIYDTDGRLLVDRDGLYIWDGQGSLPISPDIVNIDTTHLVDAAITTAKIANLAVDTEKLAALAVDAAKLATGAVTTGKLADLAVDAAKLANSAVTSTKIANLAVGTAAIQDAAINSAKIANAAVGTAAIANAAVGTAQIANAAIISALIADAAIVTAKIDDLAVNSAKIANLAVGSAKIANGAVGTLQIANQINSDTWNQTTKTGWRITKNGSIEGQAITIYDNGGNVIFSSGGVPLSAVVGAGAFAGLDQINVLNSSTYISNVAIKTAMIADAAISSAKIANEISSTTWNAGTKTGWRINRNGDIEGQSVTIYNSAGSVIFSSGGTSVANVSGLGDFATLDQITVANASTYIASAAISNALIANAAITTAKIQDLTVSTLKIANRAITSTTAKVKTASQNLSLIKTWQNVTLLVHTANVPTTSEIIIHGAVICLCRVRDADKFSVNVRLTRDGTQISPLLESVGGKPNMDVNADPEDFYFSVPFAWKMAGTGTSDVYQVQIQFADPSEGPTNFNYPDSLTITSGSMIFMENLK